MGECPRARQSPSLHFPCQPICIRQRHLSTAVESRKLARIPSMRERILCAPLLYFPLNFLPGEMFAFVEGDEFEHRTMAYLLPTWYWKDCPRLWMHGNF